MKEPLPQHNRRESDTEECKAKTETVFSAVEYIMSTMTKILQSQASNQAENEVEFSSLNKSVSELAEDYENNKVKTNSRLDTLETSFSKDLSEIKTIVESNSESIKPLLEMVQTGHKWKMKALYGCASVVGVMVVMQLLGVEAVDGLKIVKAFIGLKP